LLEPCAFRWDKKTAMLPDHALGPAAANPRCFIRSMLPPWLSTIEIPAEMEHAVKCVEVSSACSR
jgi:hypothetical protein